MTVPDDAWFLNTLRESLGARFPLFRVEEIPSDPLESMRPYESILYSLAKQDLILILSIVQTFAVTPSPRLALHALVKRLADVLGFSHCGLVLIAPDRAAGTVAISHEDPDFEGVRISLGHYPEILRSMRTGKITMVKNPFLDPLMHSLPKEQLRKIRDVSIMTLPLMCQEDVFGVLLVRKQRSKDGFVLREVRICQLIVQMLLRSLQRMCNSIPVGLEEEAKEGTQIVGAEEQRLTARRFVSSVPLGVLLIDSGTKIRMANQQASQITGLSIQQLCLMKYSDIVSDERVSEIRRMRKDEAGTVGLDRYHVSYQFPGGQRKTLSCERHRLPGTGSLSWVFLRDVTKEKEMEESLQNQAQQLMEANRTLQETRASLLLRNDELQRTNDRLDELNRMKTQFLAVATHEIRTPLSVILGYDQFLVQEKAGKIQPAQRKILEESIQSCERLLNIVNDLLDFSRIETGRLELHLREQDAFVLLKRVHRHMKLISDRARIHLRLRVPTEPLWCLHDPDRLEQVFVNLISNSIKFTAAGGEIILSARKKVESEKAYLEFSVADTGRGFAQEMIDRILRSGEPVIAEDFQRSRKKGVGLGLAISRRIVEAHGSALWAQSEEGRGATVGFCLPLLVGPSQGVERGVGIDEKQEAPTGR